jgi:RNA polymerase sigma-70 factor (ECF subfamily)
MPVENTMVLLRRIQAGDTAALDRLCERFLPRLRRWATGRLPRGARDLLDTDDLVLETLAKTLGRIPEFEPRHEGALQAYLRQAILNRIRDEARRIRVRPVAADLDGEERDPGPSPLDDAVGRDVAERYEAAFGRLKPEDQELVRLRIELDYSYQEVAEALDKPSADAARMAVSRALIRLAQEMRSGA